MHLRRALSLGIAAAVLAAIHAVPAVAQTHIPDSATQSFASFNYNATTNTNTVSYTLNGGGGATLAAVNVPVQFNFLANAFTAAASDPFFTAVYGNNNQVPTIGTTPYQANLSFTATSSGNASAGGQLFSLTSFSILSDSTSSLGAGHNLLSGTISSPMLLGPLGNTAGIGFGGSMPPQSITFTSEYATFPNGVRADLSWALNALTTPLTLSGNNYLPFNANISGQNVFKPSVVPEPGSIALLSSFGVCSTVFGFSRLRRRK